MNRTAMTRAALRTVLAAAALAAFSPAASAHELARGPNGGAVVDVSGNHVEMVATDTQLVLFLTDAADKPLASAGAKNPRAIVQDGGKTATVALTPAEPNRLVGTLPQPLGNGARVVVSVTTAGGQALQARFVRN